MVLHGILKRKRSVSAKTTTTKTTLKVAVLDQVPSLVDDSEDDVESTATVTGHTLELPSTASVQQLLYGIDQSSSPPPPITDSLGRHGPFGTARTVWWTGYEWVDRKPARKDKNIKTPRDVDDEPQKCRLRSELAKNPLKRRAEIPEEESALIVKEEPEVKPVSFPTLSTFEPQLHAALLKLCGNEDLTKFVLTMGTLQDLFTQHLHWQSLTKVTHYRRYRAILDAAFRFYLDPYDGICPIATFSQNNLPSIVPPDILILLIYTFPTSMYHVFAPVVLGLTDKMDRHPASCLGHTLQLLQDAFTTRVLHQQFFHDLDLYPWRRRQVDLFKTNGSQFLGKNDKRRKENDIVAWTVKSALAQIEPWKSNSAEHLVRVIEACIIWPMSEEYPNRRPARPPPLGLGFGQLDWPFEISDIWDPLWWGWVEVAHSSWT